MPFQLSWYLENRIVLLTIQGENPPEEMLDIDQPMIGYLDQSNAPLVHLIIDQRNTPPTPSSKVAGHIKIATQLKWPKHPRYGWSIMVGQTSTLQRFIASVGTSFFKARQRTFSTMEEGLDFLNDIDSTLPALRDNKLHKAS